MDKELCIYTYLHVFAWSQVLSGNFLLLTWEFWAFVAPVSVLFGYKAGIAYLGWIEASK